MVFDLPWPPAKLRPNSSHQGDWRGKASARKKYKEDCFWIIKSAPRHRVGDNGGPITLDLLFCPPDRRRRDLDGLLFMIKSGLDAISEAIGIDDSRFEFTLRRGEPCKPALVRVTI